MIVMAGAVLGAVWGAVLARRGGGGRLDMAQYGGACAVIGVLIGLFATIAIERLA